ncbi:MAG: tellurite resistance TerB family protein [Planctomycetota bacterium]|jgi:uncharacterized tellurite resistance protein B-like protein
MTTSSDNLNCLKNLMQLMCCDGTIHPEEKSFLARAAGELEVQVDDWNGLLKQVLNDNVPLYPVQNRDKAIATLKALIVMSKADGRVDSKEKALTVQFAKSIGVSKTEWKQILKDIDVETAELRAFLDNADLAKGVVCFHAAQDKDITVTRCRMLLDTCGDKLACILTRYQGHQVKYLLEIGLRKCIIEPVYTRDISDLFSLISK